jgi:hypothetical protein
MISHQHKTIYVHIPKTAGQSIETVFLSMLGLGWEDRGPLLLRPNQNPKNGPPRLAHLLAKEYYEHHYISRELFDQYYVFSFVRNPWDRAASFYKHLGFASKMSLQTFIMDYLRPAVRAHHWFVRPQSDFLTDDGEVIINYIGRYEALQQGFNHVLNELGLPHTTLPVVNQSRAANQQEVSWSQDAAETITEIYHQDIINFKYDQPPLVNDDQQ